MLTLGHESWAYQLLTEVIKDLTTEHGIDYIDTAMSVVQTIEGFSLERRAHLLGLLIPGLRDEINDSILYYRSESGLFSKMIQLIQQICEAAVSKDKLVQGMLLDYQNQDELKILERILSEQFENKESDQ